MFAAAFVGGAGAGVGAGDGVDFAAGVGIGAAFAAGVFAGVAAAAANQVLTPLWPLQAPDLLAAVEYVPSLQSPVAPAGAPAGACAMQSWEAKRPVKSAIELIILFIDPPCGTK